MTKEEYWQVYINAYTRIIDITKLISDFLYPESYSFNTICQTMTLEEKIEHVKNDLESQEFASLINYDFLENLEYYYPEELQYPDGIEQAHNDVKKVLIPSLNNIYFKLQNEILPLIKNMTTYEYKVKNDKKTFGKSEDEIWKYITKEEKGIISAIDHLIETLITTMNLYQDTEKDEFNNSKVEEMIKEYYQLSDLEYKRNIKKQHCSITSTESKNNSIIECNFSAFDHYFENMFGQERGIRQIEKVLKRSILFHNAEDISENHNIKKGPLATFMFYGPTGTGKTQASKIIADFVFNDKKKLLVLDMNSYKDAKIGSSAIKGHPEGYVNSESGTDFTRFLKNHNEGVIVLDEFEKAEPGVREIFMTMIDEGEFKDALGNVYDMSSYIFIATTNANPKIIEKKNTIGFATTSKVDMQAKQEKADREGLREIFTSPIMNRFNNIIHFKKIEYNDAMRICENVIMQLKKKFETKRFNGTIPSIEINNIERLCSIILEKCEYEKDGVRSLKNVINDAIGSEIIEQIIARNYHILIDVNNDEIIVNSRSPRNVR